MFTTPLNPDDEKRFQAWVKFHNVPWRDEPTADYDMRGYWRAMDRGDPEAKQTLSPFDKSMHFPDKWKTPFHKTFSNESLYAQPGAPHWVGDRLVTKEGRVLADETAPERKASPLEQFISDHIYRHLTNSTRIP